MKSITKKFFSFLDKSNGGYYSINEIARDSGYDVATYEDLIECISKIGFRNSQFQLMFRGQNKDYKDKNGSSLYPSIWRLGPLKRKKRWEYLDCAVKALLKSPILHRTEIRFLRNLKERSWAILQHYGIDTPLIDLTNDIRVAATFATISYENGNNVNPNSCGYLYVFGMPNLYQGTTISLDDGLILLRLQSVCPESARRPHLQSGYLAGSYPNYNTTKNSYKNFSVRLMAKFRIPINEDFWNIDLPLTGAVTFSCFRLFCVFELEFIDIFL